MVGFKKVDEIGLGRRGGLHTDLAAVYLAAEKSDAERRAASRRGGQEGETEGI